MIRETKAGEAGHTDAERAPARVALPQIPDVDEKSLAQVYWTLFQARILISVITIGFVLLGVTYIAFATPTYRTDVVVQVEETSKGVAGISELAGLSAGLPSDTEMEILRSRGLIGAVVDDLNLVLIAAPRRFPLLGALAKRYTGAGPAPAPKLLGLGSYAWGGERIEVQRLSVPGELLNQPLTLTAGKDGRYELSGPKGELLVAGEVGRAAVGGQGAEPVEIYVADLVARPGTRFTVMRRGRLRVIEDLQARLAISEKGRKTGVLSVSLAGPDPILAATILDAVAITYVRQNVERKSAEAAKTLEFLETQLPTLKANLDVAEAALKEHQTQKGTLDLSRESQAMLQRTVDIERSLSEAELQRADLRQRFTDNHPTLMSLSEKIAKLRADRAAMDSKMRDLPATELESARLTRDVKVASELYNLLLNRAQELRIVKSGTIGNVRILDRAAIPDRPVSPVTPLVLFASLLAGLATGVVVAFGRKSLYAGIDDPETVEHLTGMTVYATVPRSPKQASLTRNSGRRARSVLAAVAPDDPAVEAMRSLRTGLQFALLEAKNNIVVITGPTAGVGKSFVTVNLAHVIASSGRRVLVVDGDLRRGCLHRYFDAERSPGISDVLAGSVPLVGAVMKSSLENLDWIATGKIPANPAELLASERFERTLEELASRYDLVLVDTAPILPVTDAAVIGRIAATTLLVLRAGAHPVREILLSVKRLAQNGARVHAAVFNDVSGAGARYSKYAYQYRYDSRA
jgi:tyrosine-protein kinase Etk/Wzc